MDDFDITKWLRINAGVRYSWFGQVGPYTDYVYDYKVQRIDSTTYAPGKLIKKLWRLGTKDKRQGTIQQFFFS